MEMNAKERLQSACSQLADVQTSLNKAMGTVEKPGNKEEVQKALTAVNDAVSIANSACQKYRD